LPDGKHARHNNLVAERQSAILQNRFNQGAQPHEQWLIVPRDAFAQRLSDIVVCPTSEVPNNGGDESSSAHAFLLGGDAHTLCEAAPDAHKSSLGDHLIGAGMDKIRNQHGNLRSSFLVQPV